METFEEVKRRHKGTWGYSYYYERCDSGDDKEYCLDCAIEEYRVSRSIGDCCSTFRTIEWQANNSNPNLPCSFCKAIIEPYWSCCLKPQYNTVDCALLSETN